MISFCNYSFCNGKDILNPYPMDNISLNGTKIQNGIFDDVLITKDINSNYSTNIEDWDFNTIIKCDFENGTNAGNVDIVLSQLTSLRIKRRKLGDFNWITIQEIEVNSFSDLNTIKRDYFAPSNEEFEWALVPVLNGVEGQYIIESLKTDFNGVFISDFYQTFKLDKNVSYTGRTSNQSIGQILPIGKEYPTVVSNGKADYESGGISGMLLNESFDENGLIDRKETTETINSFLSFLKNGNTKIIKDWNSNIWVAKIVGNPSVSYNNSYGMGIANVSFEWVEQGKYDNEEDLKNNGLIEITL